MILRRLFLILFSGIIISILPSCSANDVNSIYPEYDSMQTDIFDETEYIIKDITPVYPEHYNILADIHDTTSFIEYKKLSIPDTINGYQTSCSEILDKSNIILLLYYDLNNHSISKELGVYNLDNGRYSSKVVFSESQLFHISALNYDHMILKLSTDNWETCGIFDYSFISNELSQIYEYSIDQDTGSVVYDNWWNNILLLDNIVWFDDYYLNSSGEIHIDAYKYDLGKRELAKVMEDAQNPLFYDGKVYLFVKNDNNEYRLLRSIDDSQTMETNEKLIEIASATNGIYCIENKYTDHENHTTEFEIIDFVTNTPILSTTSSIGWLDASANFVTWLCFDEVIPCIYDVGSKSVLIFSDFAKGRNTFLIKDNYGILLHAYNDIDYVYYFEAINEATEAFENCY